LKHATAVSLDDYVANDFLRLSVERQFEIIGEAARRILLSDPPVAVEIADLPQIVSFRNLIAHGYDETTMLGCLQLSATNFPLCWSVSGDCLAGGSRQFPTLSFRSTYNSVEPGRHAPATRFNVVRLQTRSRREYGKHRIGGERRMGEDVVTAEDAGREPERQRASGE